MAFTGIDAVTFGVENMPEARRFLQDWGLREVAASAQRLEFKTQDGTEIIVKPHDAADLPPAIEAGNTVREVVWGAASEVELAASMALLKATGDIQAMADGTCRVQDPNGLTLGFRVSQRQPVAAVATPVNAPGSHLRVNQRSPVYEQAHPLQVGHIVLFAADFPAMRGFYMERMGFHLSDEYPGHGAFLRCQLRGEHHNIFILNRPGRAGVNHVAFTVKDFHEVVGGGLAMSRKGWKTEIGPGRHPISSAYFWYFENPLAAPLEYYADDDYCTEDWKPQAFERKPELFAEWAIAGGLDGTTRRQKISATDSQRGKA